MINYINKINKNGITLISLVVTINENTSQNVWKKDTENKNQGYPILDF